MKKTLFFLIISVIFIFYTQAQTSEKLTGTIIGTSAATSSQTITKAFDNNPATWFKAQQASGGWVGLDLGQKHIITKIEFNTNDVNHNTLGVFEGSNNADFGDAIPLYLIKERLTSTATQTANINNSRGFRYVRYIGPADKYSRIAELAFYGYASAGDNSKLSQLTNLPTITIHTTNAEDIVEKEKYLKGIVTIISEDGTKIYTDSLEIRGRGNASWSFPKKPYRMKLFNKTNLLGQPAKEKNWTLINNYGDKTLMRNLLAFDLSRKLELPYTSVGIPVDVMLNGEYKGTYQLCDQMEVATGRIETDKMKATDITEPNLTGGYLIEIDAYAYGNPPEPVKFTSTRNQIPVTVKYPKDDEIVDAQFNYLNSHFNKLEAAVYATNYTDPTNGYRKYLETKTFIRHFLVGEISGNTDTYWSTYMYKKRNDDLFYVGPVWDFDIAYENDNRTYPINNNPSWIYASSGSAANGMRNFVNRIFTDVSFNNELKNTYSYYRNNGTLTEESLVAVIDNYEQELDESQKLNFTRWNILNQKVHQNFQALGSYDKEVNTVRTYIKNRIKWMDTKLGYIQGSVVGNDPASAVQIAIHGNTVQITRLEKNADIEIVDLYGRIIYTRIVNSDKHSLELEQGTYIIRITLNSNEKQIIRKCIIR